MRKRNFVLLRRALNGDERLWFVWWVWGLPAQVIYVTLYVLEDDLRSSNDLGADLMAACKLVVFCLWATMAWRCSKNVGAAAWTTAARTVLIAAVALTAITL